MNPYMHQDIFGFFATLFKRLPLFLQGKLPFEALSSDEVQLIVLSLVAFSSALVGSFLTLRKMAMFANALSHTILLGIIGAYLLLAPPGADFHETIGMKELLVASLISALLTGCLTEFVAKVLKVHKEASIGLVFTSLFSLSVLLVSLIHSNIHMGLDLVMGNADALTLQDIKSVVWVAALNLFCITLCFKELKITSFDASLARTFGLPLGFFHMLLMLLTSLSATSAFRCVGVLMVLGLFVIPSLFARLFATTLLKHLLWAGAVALSAAILGVALSRHMLFVYGLPLSTSGIVVILLVLFYLVGVVLTSTKSSLYSRGFS